MDPRPLPSLPAMQSPRLVVSLIAVALAALIAILIWSRSNEGVDPLAPPTVHATEPQALEADPVTPEPGAQSASSVTTVAADTTNRETITSARTDAALRILAKWADGTPAQGVAIKIQTAPPRVPYQTLCFVATDEEGVVQLDDAPPVRTRVTSDRGGELMVDVEPDTVTERTFEMPEGVEVTGLVVDSGGAPVPGASVVIQREGTDWTSGRVCASTGEDGRFSLRQVPTGLSIGAFAAGHSPSDLVDLDTVDTSSPPVDVRLELRDSGGAVFGLVVDAAGDPIEGAHVLVGERASNMEYRGNGSWAEAWSPRVAETDARGLFEVFGLKTGDWPIAARAEGYGMWRASVNVGAHDRSRVDITLAAAATLTGTVTDANGQPVANATVRAYDFAPRTPFIQGGQIDFDAAFGFVVTQADASGNYTLPRVTPGTVHAFAQEPRKPRSDETVPYVQEELDVAPGSITEWNPVVSAGRTIEGIVLYANGEPMGGVFITAKDEQSGVQHVLNNQRNGRFRFVCLDGATYSLHVQLWSPFKGTPALELAGIVPNQGLVELRATYSEQKRERNATVRGRIVDAGQRVTDPGTLVIQLHSEKGFWNTNFTLDGEHFEFTRVEPGAYTVLVVQGDVPIGQSDVFEVGSAEVRDMGVVSTVPGGSMLVKLDRAAGSEQIEPTLFLRRAGDKGGARIAVGRRSEIRIDNLTPGSFTVSGYGKGMSTLNAKTEVQAGGVSELEFEVQPAVLTRFEFWFPAGHAPGTSTYRVLHADGTEVLSSDRDHGKVPPRPYKRSHNFPVGSWRVELTTDTGLRASANVEITDLTPREEPVRIDVTSE